MAQVDYYLCDVCDKKVIYDADMDDRWDLAGDMVIICENCARKYRVVVEKREGQRDATKKR